MKVYAFTASWCSPCKQMKPTLDRLMATEGVHIIYKDVEKQENSNLVAKFNVRAVPTLVLLDDEGEPQGTLIGLQNENRLREFFQL